MEARVRKTNTHLNRAEEERRKTEAEETFEKVINTWRYFRSDTRNIKKKNPIPRQNGENTNQLQ
jgi:hypothetical protein